MTTPSKTGDGSIIVVGPGRMGRGIAQVFAMAGHEVTVLDVKDRSTPEFDATVTDLYDDIRTRLQFLGDTGEFDGQPGTVLDRISILQDVAVVEEAAWVFEALPEDPSIKRSFFEEAAPVVREDAVVATTTSSLSLTTLAPAVPDPSRLLITHWLNPAFIMPLVEVARDDRTDAKAVQATVDLLESIGKEPVVCADSPGFIGSRIQAAAMNEAIKVWEEGVASAAEIDRALRTGVGVRMASMGLLEFVDIGGVDILYYVDEYLSEELGERFKPPTSLREKIEEGNLGPSTGKGYYDYGDVDVDALTASKHRQLIALVDALELDESLPQENDR